MSSAAETPDDGRNQGALRPDQTLVGAPLAAGRARCCTARTKPCEEHSSILTGRRKSQCAVWVAGAPVEEKGARRAKDRESEALFDVSGLKTTPADLKSGILEGWAVLKGAHRQILARRLGFEELRTTIARNDPT